MDITVITIGDELLIGQTVDTNSAWIGNNLNQFGFAVQCILSVRDVKTDIQNAIDSSFGLTDVIIMTGGLGPTNDDITKNVLCDYFGTELVLHHESLELIKSFVEKRGYPLTETNRNQAMVPAACTPLLNRMGTAPGMWFSRGKKILISLPGVPYEMKDLMEKEVIPRLISCYKLPPVEHRYIQTHGIPEAFLADKLRCFENCLPSSLKLAFLPSQGIIKLRLSIYEASIQQTQLLDKKYAELCSIIPEYIIALNDESFQMNIGQLLLQRNKKLSLAESCTGGYISHLFTQIPGCSAWYQGGVVAYSNQLKTEILGVDPVTLQQFGAVSVQVAEQMASGAKQTMHADYSISTTGIAGPDGGTPDKPVGTVCIAMAT
ncbi:MAG TPA: CinA family nicotinamide mononucleotide deamidase-related protein, partial [Prolixibacteraceae bacterium]|nr:CinA family nicotinamide mononucleotide deamidase-related protein [Prolixibacteraceae bacterium]